MQWINILSKGRVVIFLNSLHGTKTGSNRGNRALMSHMALKFVALNTRLF